MKKLLLAMAACLCGFSVLATDYEITVTGDANLSSLLTGTPTVDDTLVITATATDATLTLDASVVFAKLTVTSDLDTKLTLTSSGTPAGAFDFSGAKGELYINFDTGSAAVTSGADTYFSYAGTGKLTVPADSRATLTSKDVWSSYDTASSAYNKTDAKVSLNGITSIVRVMPEGGAANVDTVPFGKVAGMVTRIAPSDQDSSAPVENGTIDLAGLNDAITVFELYRDSTTRFVISTNFEFTAFQLGAKDNGNNISTHVYIDGGNVLVNEKSLFTNQDQRRVWFYVLNGSYTATNQVTTVSGTSKSRAYMNVGGASDGNAQAMMTVKGLSSSKTTYSSYLDIKNQGLVKIIGTEGLVFTASAMKLNLAGGTLEFTENAPLTVAHTDGVKVSADSTIEIARGKTVTVNDVNTKITGDGILTINATGEGEEAAIFDLGTIRTDTPLALGDGVKLALKLTDLNESIALNATKLDETRFDATELVLTDPTGESIDTSKIQVVSDGNGGVTITASVPTLTLTEDADFTVAGNWAGSNIPTSGNIVINATGNVTITLPETVTAETHAYAIVKVTGGGTVSFAGDGAMAVESIEIEEKTTLVQSGKFNMAPVSVGEGSTYVLDATNVSDGLTSTAVISGDGAVETLGTVVMDVANTFTGGLTVKTGKISMTVTKGYGPVGANVTVENGACADMNHINGSFYNLFISGDGYEIEPGVWSGALWTSGGDIASGTSQLASITLNGDARVVAKNRWGLSNYSGGWKDTKLTLNGHTLTVSGEDFFWFAKTSTTDGDSGTICIRDGIVCVCKESAALDGVTLKLEGGAILQAEQNVTGLEALEFPASDGEAVVLKSKQDTEISGIITAAIDYLDAARWKMSGGVIDIFQSATVDHTGGITVTADSTFKLANETTLTLTSLVEGEGKLNFVTVDGGSATVDLGTGRPAASLTFGAGVNVVVRLAEEQTFFTLKASGLTTENLIVYDAAGVLISSDNISSKLSEDQSTVTFYTSIPVLQPTGDEVSFTSAGEWSAEEYPTRGNFIVETKQSETVTVDLTDIPEGCKYNAVTVKGGGTLQFVNGVLAVNEFVVDENATLVQSGCLVASGETTPMSVVLNEGATYVVDASDRMADDPLASTAVISGAGKVETYGYVVMTTKNTFTGGLTVKPGSYLQQTTPGGFGGSGGAYSGGSVTIDAQVIVEDGGCVDVANALGDCYHFVIAGAGIKKDGRFTGAMMNSGSAYNVRNRKVMSRLDLTADALIVVDSAWGMVLSDKTNDKKGTFYDTQLNLNGKTLTKRGSADFTISGATVSEESESSGGTIRVETGKFQIYAKECVLPNVTVQLVGSAILRLEIALDDLAALEFSDGEGAGANIEYYQNERHLDVNTPWIFNRGTLKITDGSNEYNVKHPVDHAGGIRVDADSTIKLDNGLNIPLASPITGEGTLVFEMLETGTAATVDFGTSRPAAPIAVRDGVKLMFTLEEGETDITLPISDAETLGALNGKVEIRDSAGEAKRFRVTAKSGGVVTLDTKPYFFLILR